MPNDHVRAVLTRQARGHVGRPPTGSPSLRVGDRVGQAVIARIGCFGWWGTLNPRPTHSSLRWGSPPFTYKGKPVDVKQVAQELGVRYVLEGSVRKAGNRVRITGQLIDTTTGAHIWADRFDGALDDIFELQDQVASNVAGAIEPKLRQSEIERASRKPTANLTAYDLYLRALAQSARYTEEGLAEAVVLAHDALPIYPCYPPAAAMVGWCRALQRIQGWGALSDEDIGEACHLARQALEAERDDAETVCRAAMTLFHLAGEAATSAALRPSG